MSLFCADRLSYTVKGKPLVLEASFALEPGTLTMLVGPNGAGKTTLLRLALGLLKPDSGTATLEGSDVSKLAPVQRARKVAYLPQQRPLIWPQPVRDIVALGRFAFGAAPGKLSREDEAATARAIATCNLEGFEERAADTLSGGELSRVHLARALAAETALLVTDEPVAALDPRYQHEVLRIFSDLAREGKALLTVVHDLGLAARYADRLLWMKDGRIVAEGTPRETMTSDRLRTVFDIKARIDATDAEAISLNILGPA
ncbi:ABC transporter ATP-binding protein [Croceicoccus sp. F390]|uniref:ABC transporter ATP-binding protein n=1 Tax=Croceicoccus esteveae TaxID=3075597 RepID=A0ABU2ZLJ4_9SPHN|nr:ABC transporter ATP-binding protein [Croceicoccus sp. F390]MDT0577101.1 ABC transporter ATP-binding protein [Croceicoccus sp. F390]